MKRSHKKANAARNGEWSHHVRKGMKKHTAKMHRQFDRIQELEMLAEVFG